MQAREFLVAALWVAAACGSSPRRPPTPVETVLDSLVMGPQIGARAAPVATQLHLPFAPHVGYADTGFRAPAGVHGLVLRVDETLASETDRPTRWALIKNIGIGFFTRAGADSARQLLTRHLGPPFCYVAGSPDRPVALYFWPNRGPEGVVLNVPLQPPESPYVAFGVPGPDPTRLNPKPCDAP